MKLKEAEHKARRSLYEFEQNVAMLERKEDLATMFRGEGSRVQQYFEERGGKVTGRYVDSVPWWLQNVESLEARVFDLISTTTTTRGLLAFAEKHHRELFDLYAAKYRDSATLPELRRRFGSKLKRIDRELAYQLILWCGWRIEIDGGEDYAKWLRKRQGY